MCLMLPLPMGIAFLSSFYCPPIGVYMWRSYWCCTHIDTLTSNEFWIFSKCINCGKWCSMVCANAAATHVVFASIDIRTHNKAHTYTQIHNRIISWTSLAYTKNPEISNKMRDVHRAKRMRIMCIYFEGDKWIHAHALFFFFSQTAFSTTEHHHRFIIINIIMEVLSWCWPVYAIHFITETKNNAHNT